MEKINENLVEMLKATIARNWNVEAMSDLHQEAITYGRLATRIARNQLLFEKAGIRPGDKIALIGKNSVNWAVAFLSCLTYGATCVPILHEFHPDQMTDLINHSDARLLFVDTAIWQQLNIGKLPSLDGVIDIDSDTALETPARRFADAVNNFEDSFKTSFPEGVTPADFSRLYFAPNPDDLAVINYTSGSTGNSKGVMIPYRALWSNARYAVDNIPYLHPGDGIVSMLPLAHMFGMLVELIFPLLKGCHITFLGRVPSPKILLDAFAEVKPKLVVTVPLVIEKIVRNKVFPALQKQPVKTLAKIPLLNKLIFSKVKKQMIAAFGGNLEQLIIGGAALSSEVEAFLRRIGFPYTIGYGMTECAPLISYCEWSTQKAGSCGKVVDRMEVRIDSPDPANQAGTLWVKGDNVMIGYYKNPEATEAVMDADGWMNTGDVVERDADGYLFIRGRDKSMILGPSGQNIYPEEIENELNALPFVAESLVVERGGKLVALIVPDYEAAKKASISREKISEIMDLNLVQLNRNVPAYSRVASVELRDEPFEKTPKHSIRRFLYK